MCGPELVVLLVGFYSEMDHLDGKRLCRDPAAPKKCTAWDSGATFYRPLSTWGTRGFRHSMTCDNADAETPVEPSHHMPH